MSKSFIFNKTTPIINTKAGKIRGFIADGIYTFHGIKYADAERFMPPCEVQSWDGVKDAISYGYVCPMLDKETAQGEIMVPHRYWPKDENCQYLNIWTKSTDKTSKKPVMVWLHGGGFVAGSSIEQVAYDGDNLARHGDVVMVSLNHRLNILGYLDLSPFSDKYKNSANAGNADIVMALKWIKDNIAEFGGDPDNVTLFGQSGGGMKVWTLMQTPEANGLFHKGIIQSGVFDGFDTATGKEDTSLIGKALLKELNIDEKDIQKLETLPYEVLAQAYNKVKPDLENKGEYCGLVPLENEFYLGDPRVVGFTEHAKTIPVIVGTVIAEFAAFAPGIDKYNMSDVEIYDMLKITYKENTDKIIDLFKNAYPTKNIADLMMLDSVARAASIDFALKKAVHTQAPTYSYMFSLEMPIENKPAWHCAEIPFVFYNTDLVPMTWIDDVTQTLQNQMAFAWINFAKTGDPNNEYLPTWEKCESDKETVMLFDEKCEQKTNYDHELVKLHKEITPSFFEKKPETESEEEFILH